MTPPKSRVPEEPLPADQTEAMERQRLADRQENHEKLCIENQKRIDEAFRAVNSRLERIDLGLGQVLTAQAANAAVAAAAITGAKPRWWHPIALTVTGLLITAIISLLAWMGSTIFSLEQEKITALQNRPAANVTFNPAASAPTGAPAPGPTP